MSAPLSIPALHCYWLFIVHPHPQNSTTQTHFNTHTYIHTNKEHFNFALLRKTHEIRSNCSFLCTDHNVIITYSYREKRIWEIRSIYFCSGFDSEKHIVYKRVQISCTIYVKIVVLTKNQASSHLIRMY